MAGDAAHALRYLLLNAAVGDVGIGLVGHPLAEARYQETLGNGCTECHGMALAQRARGILHAVEDIHLGMARRDAAPLAQRLEVLRRIEARQRERRVEHRRHVSRVEEEAVTERIAHVRGVVAQELGVEHRDEVRAAHGAARVARFRFFDHRGRQNPDVVGYSRKFGIGRHIISKI